MDNEIIDKLCRRSFIFAVLGTCIVGICPALGIMSLVIDGVLKSKGIRLSDANKDRLKKAKILSIISLVMFVIDIAIAMLFYKVINK